MLLGSWARHLVPPLFSHVSLHVVFPRCVCLGPVLLFSFRDQSCGTRTHLDALIFTGLHLQRLLFLNKVTLTVVCVLGLSVLSDSLRPHGLWAALLSSPWNFPGKNTGVGCCFLLQDIFPTQGSNLGLPHCKQTLYSLSHQGSPKY